MLYWCPPSPLLGNSVILLFWMTEFIALSIQQHCETKGNTVSIAHNHALGSVANNHIFILSFVSGYMFS